MDAAAVSTSLDSALGFQLCLGFGVTPHRTRTLIQTRSGATSGCAAHGADRERLSRDTRPRSSWKVARLRPGMQPTVDGKASAPLARHVPSGSGFGSLLEL